jgi:hypothetical protein
VKKVKPCMVVAEPHGGSGVYLVLCPDVFARKYNYQVEFWSCLVLCAGNPLSPYDYAKESDGTVISIRERWIQEESEEL